MSPLPGWCLMSSSIIKRLLLPPQLPSVKHFAGVSFRHFVAQTPMITVCCGGFAFGAFVAGWRQLPQLPPITPNYPPGRPTNYPRSATVSPAHATSRVHFFRRFSKVWLHFRCGGPSWRPFGGGMRRGAFDENSNRTLSFTRPGHGSKLTRTHRKRK